MCMSCGCKQPNERHGDDRNIIRQDLEDAARAADISAKEAVKNIQEGFDGASGEGGETKATAGQQTR